MTGYEYGAGGRWSIGSDSVLVAVVAAASLALQLALHQASNTIPDVSWCLSHTIMIF